MLPRKTKEWETGRAEVEGLTLKNLETGHVWWSGGQNPLSSQCRGSGSVLVGELDPTCLTKSSHAATKTGHSKTDISKNKINF